MKEPGRLETLLGWVPPGLVVADVGAGDGLLARALAMRGTPRVIATEAREGPHGRLTERLAGMAGVEVRFGRGLGPLRPGEASVIVIAGMGTRTIMKMLASGEDVARSARRLILQPMGDAGPLKELLVRMDLPWAGEDLAFEDGHFYEILVTDTESPRLRWEREREPLGPSLSRRQDRLALAYRGRVADRLRARIQARRRAGIEDPGLEDLLDALEGKGGRIREE